MQVEVGALLQGKITGITKYGVFVDIGEGASGMVHISEIADTYVKEISDYVEEGQQVSVKVLNIDERGRIALSMKQAGGTGSKGGTGSTGSTGGRKGGEFAAGGRRGGDTPSGGRKGGEASGQRRYQNNRSRGSDSVAQNGAYPQEGVVRNSTDNKNFDDMLSRFMKSSDERISGLRKNGEHRPRRGNRK